VVAVQVRLLVPVLVVQVQQMKVLLVVLVLQQ
jgi:hypothetical protein